MSKKKTKPKGSDEMARMIEIANIRACRALVSDCYTLLDEIGPDLTEYGIGELIDNLGAALTLACVIRDSKK